MDYTKRRERFTAAWKGGDFVLHGATRPDDALPWRQDRDFLYLTGVDEPGAFVQFKDGAWTLFLEERNAWDALWHGARPSFEDIQKISGVTEILPDREPRSMPTDGVHELVRSLRLIKDADEITVLKKANEISLQMFADLELRPGMSESDIEGELYRRMRMGGGFGWAYPPIVASGVNATVLHYTKNNRVVEEGDLVLIDAGSEYSGYASDITRTFCVGEMSGEKRAIHDLVTSAQRAAIAAVSHGKTLKDIDAAARGVLRNGLKDLGIIKDTSQELGAEKIFFPHGTSHWIGLDVHDPCPAEGPLAPGMSFTVEPGLYFRNTDDPLDIYRGRLKEKELEDLTKAIGEWESYRGIGVRIEDDIML